MMSILALSGGFTWLGSLLPEAMQHMPHHQGQRLAHSILVVVIVLGLALLARLALMRTPSGREGLVPEANLKPKNLVELYVESMLNMVRGILGKEDGDFYFPLIAGLFAYIFVSNILGVLPGFAPPTDHLNTNLPMALTVFFVYNVAGIIRQGPVNYFKHLLGPVLWLGPLMFLVEAVGHLVRPASLSIRLYGNMSGDHLVLDIFMNQLPDVVGAFLGWGLPVIFLGLGIFVSLIQAFVFSLLSLLYIALAIEKHDDHH